MIPTPVAPQRDRRITSPTDSPTCDTDSQNQSHTDSRELSHEPSRPRPLAMQVALWAAIILTATIAVASFVLSFNALRELTIRAGQPAGLAALFPIVVDGAILQATISLAVLAKREAERLAILEATIGLVDLVDPELERITGYRRFFWTVLTVGSAASIGFNALHAFLAHAAGFNPYLAAGLATVAPIGLLASTHGLTVLISLPTRPAPLITAQTSLPPRSVPAAAPPVAALPVLAQISPPEQHPGGMSEPVRRDDSAPVAGHAAGSPAGEESCPGDDELKRRAYELYGEGFKAKDIAPKVGRTKSTIYRWLNEAEDAGILRLHSTHVALVPA